MITVSNTGCYYHNGALVPAAEAAGFPAPADARRETMAACILAAHNTTDEPGQLRLKVDAMASHDITYVGIIQTCRASGIESFPVPYVLTNCHNSLCAVGGTINEDDHRFGLSAARRYGGEFVPAHQAVIHQYMRERYAAPGRMILASDSHTRYGPFGTLAVGEGGPELGKQLLGRTYDLTPPPVIAIYLTGAPRPGVGPQDVALALIGEVFASGAVKNSVCEFIGPGIANLAMDYRSGIDVMTTETACLSSVWETDETVRKALETLGRGEQYKEQHPGADAYYDGSVVIELDKIEPMIALPFHPSNAYTIRVFKENMSDILNKLDQETERQLEGRGQRVSLLTKIRDGKFLVDQGVIAGCSGGTLQNLLRATDILRGAAMSSVSMPLSCYPASLPVLLDLERRGCIAELLSAGATVRSCFCGPCFGAGDVPANNAFSIRHSTRNFPHREGSRPADGQLSWVALMDARSIAATAKNGGVLTAATELPEPPADPAVEPFQYDDAPYAARVYRGVGKPDPDAELVFGPNIADWPPQVSLPENLLLTVCSAIYDPVTTTDELIPSGETSSYRSNPLRLAEFTLSRKDPAYVGRAKEILALERKRREDPADPAVRDALLGHDGKTTGLGSLVLALKPGDGSAREQAASCQRVLGGCANIAQEYATKRYRSNVINWGMLPFIVPELEALGIRPGDRFWIPGIRAVVDGGADCVEATLIRADGREEPVTLRLPNLAAEERAVILAGCLINQYRE
ncbi:MAG: hydratase [Oscillospiraceae bacterium]|nr:hydratase [Oscillospiraceae bacterium]